MTNNTDELNNRTYPLNGALTPANVVTVSRIFLTPLLCVIVLSNPETEGTSWFAFSLAVFMGFTDLIDGRVARATNGFSKSGAFLDPLADKIVILAVGFTLVSIGRLELLPMALIAIREVAVSGLRVRFAAQGAAIPARPLAKWKATVQGLALLLALLPIFTQYHTAINLVLWFAAALTVFTGAQYFIDGEKATRR